MVKRLVEHNWRKWEQGINTVQVMAEDFQLYLMWGLDLIKEQDEGVNGEFRDRIYSALRQRFVKSGFTWYGPDAAYIADLISATCLYCYGFVLTESLSYLQEYEELLRGLGSERERILGIRDRIEAGGDCNFIKEWMVKYMASEKYYTNKDEIEWAEEGGNEVLIRRTRNKHICAKVDLYRVIMALYWLGAFESVDGSQLGPEKVFEAFGNMLGEDFSTYANNLSSGSNNKGDANIFVRLEEAFGKYEACKEKKKNDRR